MYYHIEVFSGQRIHAKSFASDSHPHGVAYNEQYFCLIRTVCTTAIVLYTSLHGTW